MSREIQYGPQLEQLKALDFIRNIKLKNIEAQDAGFDAKLSVRTPEGEFGFLAESRSSFLDRSFVNFLISRAQKYRLREEGEVLLLARYVPLQTAERLIEAGVNFVDALGNMHIKLGDRYERTIIGKKEAAKAREAKTTTPAKVQALFTLAAHPEAAGWNVRKFAETSGISKSTVANVRQQLIEEGVLTVTKNGARVKEQAALLHEQLLSGYEQILRPRLYINRYQVPGSTLDEVIKHIQKQLDSSSIRYSLSGGPASYLLNHFYQGPELPLFLEHIPPEIARKLKLIPAKEGRVIALRSFGELPFWKTMEGISIAHPLLIYCELMHSNDPRAHEVAEEFRTEYLQNG
jgi:hypothetical protein